MIQIITTLQVASSQVQDLLAARHRKLLATRESGLEAATVAIIAVASIAATVAIIAVASIAAAVVIGGIVTFVVNKYGSKLRGA